MGAMTQPAYLSLAGKSAVVLGASSGFGRAIAERFAEAGARVVVAARRLELLEPLAKELDGAALRCDIARDADVASLARFALERNGRIDIAVNCAGFEQMSPLRDLTPERLDAMRQVQFDGALYFMRHMANAMETRGGGSIVTISSLTAHRPAAGLAAYAGSKRAVEYVSQIAAVEYGAQRVRVNCVAASLIETPMTAAMFKLPMVTDAMLRQTPLPRMGEVRDIVEAVHWLASDASSFVTGQTLCVDGGGSLTRLPSAQDFVEAAQRAATRSQS
jgi:NAD(P)-dependent dehydrogenase (short-subunit alcohol dehydrogenase family)